MQAGRGPPAPGLLLAVPATKSVPVVHQHHAWLNASSVRLEEPPTPVSPSAPPPTLNLPVPRPIAARSHAAKPQAADSECTPECAVTKAEVVPGILGGGGRQGMHLAAPGLGWAGGAGAHAPSQRQDKPASPRRCTTHMDCRACVAALLCGRNDLPPGPRKWFTAPAGAGGGRAEGRWAVAACRAAGRQQDHFCLRLRRQAVPCDMWGPSPTDRPCQSVLETRLIGGPIHCAAAF